MGTSVILPAYVPNQELLDLTIKCLDSLWRTADRESYDLTVVDNGSSADASNVLFDACSIDWGDHYIHFSEPIGYARAANVGIALARYPWICALNTDIEFTTEGWIERFQKDYKDTPGGILSAVDDGRKGLIYDESWFSCWITKRSVVEKVGYFDESLPFRFHDQDYAIRLTEAGYRVMRTGNVQVKHVDSATYDTMGRDEDPAEEALMRERWGAKDFAEWRRLTPA